MKDYWKLISVGLLVYLLISYFPVGTYLLFGLIIELQIPHGFSEIIFFISEFNIVVPGLVVGYLAKESGILLGLIVGVLGASLTYSLIELNLVASSAGTVFVIKQFITMSLVNAVGGGCGELIRIKRSTEIKAIN